MLRHRYILAVLLPLALAVFACGARDKDSAIDYSRNAERFYQAGIDEYEDKDCLSADRIFQRIRKKFPYSRYAVLAELTPNEIRAVAEVAQRVNADFFAMRRRLFQPLMKAIDMGLLGGAGEPSESPSNETPSLSSSADTPASGTIPGPSTASP